MSLIQLNTMDLLSADPFSHAEVLYDQHLGDIESLLHGNDLEVEWPATPAQCQILVSDEMPSCKIRLILPRLWPPYGLPFPARGKCISGWCTTLGKSNGILSRLGQHSSSNSSLAGAPVEDDLAQLIVCRDPSSGSYRLTLPARRAAVDGTSLEIIKRNFILLYCGLPLPQHTPLAAYQYFLKETKDTTSSIAFWKAQLKGAVPPVALPWRQDYQT